MDGIGIPEIFFVMLVLAGITVAGQARGEERHWCAAIGIVGVLLVMALWAWQIEELEHPQLGIPNAIMIVPPTF